ncbi:MAG: hypothetical protein DRJ52_01300 [Thermoprotei archaeon]|nr:MAG: hypothetical protein DRJ52_01300 [Thermoprotei archaeon]RLF01165.1 MAG: hypothetical protein DRJ63_00240 [Thermoprotei archaeon]HDI75318.1 hypothetical protein [Thermoprotei archaeon]
MSRELTYMKFKSLEDLVKLIVTSQRPLLFHSKYGENKHIYYIYGTAGQRLIIYYTVLEKPIEKKYIYYSVLEGKISFGDELNKDTRFVNIPVIEVEDENILKEIL